MSEVSQVNHRSMATVPVFSLAARDGSRITLRSEEGLIAHIFVLEEDILRVMVLPEGRLSFPRTWAIAPGLEEVPLEGRDRFNLEGFTVPIPEILEEENKLTITTGHVRLTVKLRGFFCRWEVRQS